MALFELGRVVVTRMALEFCDEHSISIDTMLARHQRGDWGDYMDAVDRRANDDAVKYDDRVISSYVFDQGRVWIITEADRSSTCILLPEDY